MHYNHMAPCLTAKDESEKLKLENCETFAEEVADIKAYREYVKEVSSSEQMSASAVYVALHNLVTKTIEGEKWQPNGRHQLYCLPTVVQALYRIGSFDFPEYSAQQVSVGSESLASHVTGLGPNSSPGCSM